MSGGGTNQPLFFSTLAPAIFVFSVATVDGPSATAAVRPWTTAALRCSLDGWRPGPIPTVLSSDRIAASWAGGGEVSSLSQSSSKNFNPVGSTTVFEVVTTCFGRGGVQLRPCLTYSGSGRSL